MSKIIEEFEKGYETWEYSYEIVPRLLTHARALEAMLRNRMYTGKDHTCFSCGYDHFDGHYPDCKLARLLE